MTAWVIANATATILIVLMALETWRRFRHTVKLERQAREQVDEVERVAARNAEITRRLRGYVVERERLAAGRRLMR